MEPPWSQFLFLGDPTCSCPPMHAAHCPSPQGLFGDLPFPKGEKTVINAGLEGGLGGTLQSGGRCTGFWGLLSVPCIDDFPLTQP